MRCREIIRNSIETLAVETELLEEDIDVFTDAVAEGLTHEGVTPTQIETISAMIQNGFEEQQATRRNRSGGQYSARTVIESLLTKALLVVLEDHSSVSPCPQDIVLIGETGAGTTTTAAKLATWFTEHGLSVAIIRTERHTYNRISNLPLETGVTVYSDGNNPIQILRDGYRATEDADVRIVDTKGFSTIESGYGRLRRITATASPDSVFVVIEASTNGRRKRQLAELSQQFDNDGVIVTRCDRGIPAAVFSIEEAEFPVAFLGTGEGLTDLKTYDPTEIITKLTGIEHPGERAALLDTGDLDLLPLKRAMERPSSPGSEEAADGRSHTDALTFEVAKGYTHTLGKGIASLDPESFLELNLSPGDIVEIEGSDRTAAKVWRLNREDWNAGIIRIDGYTRGNAGIAIGEIAEIRKAKEQPAEKLSLLSLNDESSMKDSSARFVERQLVGRPVVEGDLIQVLSSSSQPWLRAPGHAIQFEAVETSPSGPVVINESTTVEFSQTELAGSEKPEDALVGDDIEDYESVDPEKAPDDCK